MREVLTVLVAVVATIVVIDFVEDHAFFPEHTTLSDPTGTTVVNTKSLKADGIRRSIAVRTRGAKRKEKTKRANQTIFTALSRRLLQTSSGSSSGSGSGSGSGAVTRRRRHTSPCAPTAAPKEEEEEIWWAYPQDYTQVETLILVVLVAISLCWEVTLENFEEAMEETGIGLRAAYTLNREEKAVESDESEGDEEGRHHPTHPIGAQAGLILEP